MLALVALIGFWQIQLVESWQDEARFRLMCPQASCWHYWNGNCYCLEVNQKGTWIEALKFCKRYSFTELVTLRSIQEENWLLGLPLDNFWIGLNNLEDTECFSWSEGTRADTKLSWLQLSNPVQPNTCVKVSKNSLVAVDCYTEAHWICQRSATVDRYQEHKGKVLLSPATSPSQVHTDLISAKIACLELREQCTGITKWNNDYALARGTVLVKSEDSQSAAYVKTDCSLGYFGIQCSNVCNRCHGDELCNPYTGDCDSFHSCSSQDSPAVCEQAMNSVWCPPFSGWKYWGRNCYYFSIENAVSWTFAQQQCRRFRSTDLIWIDNKREMNWILSAGSKEIFWTGLNSMKRKYIWVWSHSVSAAKELRWLKLRGHPSERCVGIDIANKTALRLDCDTHHRWICKRKEVEDLFDAYTDRFMSGALEKVYTSLSIAVVDCLTDLNCTGIVQDDQFFRRTKGIDDILTSDETAITYKKRVCSFGYYGNNCASVCKKCYGGFICNSVTGQCPERLQCIGHFKGELCELGLRSTKCPLNAPWWFHDGHCYYFEKEKKGKYLWANAQCSYYKGAKLLQIDSPEEKEWVGAMLESESWIGMLQEGNEWRWSDNRGKVDVVKYSWLWDFPATRSKCAQIMRGGRLLFSDCIQQHFYICKIKIAGQDLFIEYPRKIILSSYALAMYTDLNEAKFFCTLNRNCTGITSWPLGEHFLVTGTEMIPGSYHHRSHLKTSCTRGHHGYLCENKCPKCRNNLLCNMLTGFCDEKSSCLDQSSLESCSGSTVSERCPDTDKWRYYNRHCYYFVSTFKTWQQANLSCSRFKSAELLWIEDAEELKWLKIFILVPIWTGFNDMDYDGIWAWSYGQSATDALKWVHIQKTNRWKRCADVSHEGNFLAERCYEKKKSACKRPAEQDHDIFAGFWDSVVISSTPSLLSNFSYNVSKDECIKKKSACLGYGLWKNGYFLLNGHTMVGGGFGPSVMFLKSECDYGHYGPECDNNCPHCHWEKLCHPSTGRCELPIICAAPESVGSCSLGLYSLKCSLGTGWWYWKGKCYLIEKNRNVTWNEALKLCSQFKDTKLLQLDNLEEKEWLQKMITKPMWIGVKWNEEDKNWHWGDGSIADFGAKGLKIKGDTRDSCGILPSYTRLLETAKCRKKLYFICERKEDVDIFQKYNGYIIADRQNILPISFRSLKFAKEECIFERNTCTGVVFSEGQFYLVSGRLIFRSINANDILFIKSACSDGFYGTNCQFKCQKCKDNHLCNPITGQCISSLTKCRIISPDPKCIEQVFTDLCPKKYKWYYYAKSCYYVENVKETTWENARMACQGFKETDLVKITNSREKMWVQYKGGNSWIGLKYYKHSSQYLWIDKTSSVFQNAWVIRQNRRHPAFDSYCGVAFKQYLSVTDCSLRRKWICKRKEVVDLFTEHVRRAFYLPDGKAATYTTLDKAKEACLGLQTCTGVTSTGKDFLMHTSMHLYNTRNTSVKTWIKSDCAAGRYGKMCEYKCHECEDGISCNPLLGLCVDTVFCNKNDSTFTCEKGILIGGRCPCERNWLYWQGSCYYIHKGKQRTWQQARAMCRRYNNTDLVWITSKAEKKWLLSVLPKGHYWIGLHGNMFCNNLRWVYTTSEMMLYGESWTVYWKCCIYLVGSEGSMPASKCSLEAFWICKKREEEASDFHRFDGYFLPGISEDKTIVKHKTLRKAFQHCRFRRKNCTGIQRVYADFIITHAKRLVLLNVSMPNVYTAYIKSACAPGYYGTKCNKICTCNGTENCNPFTGQCTENEQCDEDAFINECEKGVIHLKCPKDPGWWYWKGNCYYIETINRLPWKDAVRFCTSYHEARLLPMPQSSEEKVWLTTVLKNDTWIDTDSQNKADVGVSGKTLSTCKQMKKDGTFQEADCFTLTAWVCKRSIDTDIFRKYPRSILIFPLGSKIYKKKTHAESACLLEKECTGISYWQNKYLPVSGKELILSESHQDTAYVKTACTIGRYGPYCQKKCPECPENRPCNGLTGKCTEELKCTETDSLNLCEFRLALSVVKATSKYVRKHALMRNKFIEGNFVFCKNDELIKELKSRFCYYSWIYFNSHCYYIPKYGKINKSDAEYMCSQFKQARLVDLTSYEEKDWLTKIISEQIWIQRVGPAFYPKVVHMSKEGKMAQRIPSKVQLCLQLLPENGQLVTIPCFYNASWACKSPLASEPVDAPEKWWMSLVSSLIATVIVLIVTMFSTITYGFRTTRHQKK